MTQIFVNEFLQNHGTIVGWERWKCIEDNHEIKLVIL